MGVTTSQATVSATATALIPGNPNAVLAFARRVRATGDDAVRPIAVDQQRAETATGGWVGAGGDAARARLHVVGQVWSDAANVLDQLADAIEVYTRALQRAQADAAQAVSYQNQARASSWSAVALWYHSRAELTLRTAQVQLYFASTTLAACFDQATRTLPTPAPPRSAAARTPSQWVPSDTTGDCGPDWVDPEAVWQLPSGTSYPCTPGSPWPSSLYPPSVLSDTVLGRLGDSPYQDPALRALAKKRGWALDGFGFAGLNVEGDIDHKGWWGFVGAFAGPGVEGVGTGEAGPVFSAGAILGHGPAYTKVLGDGDKAPELTLESGLLYEGGATWSRDGLKPFGSLSNPILYSAAALSLPGRRLGLEAGTLVHNEPGQSCAYSVFGGIEDPRVKGEGHLGPVHLQWALWEGAGVTLTVPSAATTPWECLPMVPQWAHKYLPWWDRPRE